MRKTSASLQGFLILLLMLVSATGWAQESPAPLKLAAGDKVLTIASTDNFPPINLLDENGELQGFARDISTAVAKAIGYKVRYLHSAHWTQVEGWLKSGKADLIHDTGYTRDRDAYLDFTNPIIEMTEVIFVRQNQYAIRNIESLKYKKVACVDQHISHLYLQRIPEIICHVVNTPAEGIAALVSGTVEAFVYPEQIVRYLAQDMDLGNKIKVTGNPLHHYSWSMTVREGDRELLELLNRGIASIKQSGQYDRIYDKWFGKNLLEGYSTQEVVLFTTFGSILSILLGLMIGLGLYTKKLRRAHLSLMESEDKYRTLVDKLPQRIFLKDRELNYVSCNKQYADDLGISPEQIVGKSDFDFHSKNAEEYRRGDLAVMDSDEAIEFVEDYEEDGKKGTIQTTKLPMHDENGKVSGVLGIFWDITEQKQLQEKLSSLLREHTTITDTVPDVLYKLDTNGSIVWCNRQLEHITGNSKEQLIGKSALEIIADADKKAVAAAIARIFNTGFARVEAHLLTQSGATLYDFNGATLTDEKGTVIGLTGMGRDISKEKAAEKEHEQLQQQLQQAQKMEAIGQLTGGIAHDFNNMLASILGYADLALQIEAGNAQSKTAGYLQEICKAGNRAKELISQMLTFSRGTKGEMNPLSLNKQLADTVKMLRPMLPSSTELHLEAEDNVPAIMGDSVQIQQLLTNLCINARDAMMGQGYLTLKLEVVKDVSLLCNSCHAPITGDFVAVTVKDTGHGIPPDMLDRIFEPFITTKAVGKGTGMGLAMVHGIVHEHGGHIVVKSDINTGTTFQVFFPILESVAISAESEKLRYQAAPTHHPGDYHILVVDDEPSVMEMISEVLKAQGYQVTGVTESQEALTVFSEDPNRFDLVVTDQTMPGFTGSEMAQTILMLRPELPIILCTGYSEHIDEKGAQTMGISAFLHKPLDQGHFLSLVEKLLSPKTETATP